MCACIPKVCERDISCTAWGNLTKFSTDDTFWGQRWTDYILRSKGHRSSYIQTKVRGVLSVRALTYAHADLTLYCTCWCKSLVSKASEKILHLVIHSLSMCSRLLSSAHTGVMVARSKIHFTFEAIFSLYDIKLW